MLLCIERNKMIMTATKFIKGQKVKYLGFNAIVKSVSEQYGKIYYAVSYQGDNGKRTARGITEMYISK